MHRLYGALPGPYVPVRVTRCALVSHRYTNASPRCRTLQYRNTFISLSLSLWNDLGDPIFDGVGRAGLKSRANVRFLQYVSFNIGLIGLAARSPFTVWGIAGLESSDS